MTRNILRLPAVLRATGLSRSSNYVRIDDGLFPKPINLGGRAVGWPADEVEAITAARIAGKSNTEIRTLVVMLESARRGDVAGFVQVSRHDFSPKNEAAS